MDADNANAQVAQGATNESTPTADELFAQYEELAKDFPENSDGDLGYGDDGADGTPAGDGEGDDGSESSLDDDLGDGGTETDETDDPGDGEPGETDDDDAGQSESADDDPAAASEGEPSEESVEPEPKPEPKLDRKTERTLQAVKEYAEYLGFDSVEAMLAEREDVDVETVKARLESEELTVEEKAALYDAEHAKSKEAEKADAERRGREAVLQALYADFPTIKDTVKDLDKDIKNPDRFLKLLLAGNTPREAFLATGNVPPRNAPVPNGKSHLVPDIRAKRSGGSSLSASELRYYRSALGDDVSDNQIENYVKRVK